MSQYQILSEQLVDDFMSLVRIDSPSKDERAVADWLTEKFTELGCVVKEDNAGDEVGGNAGNLKVFLKGNVEGKGSLLFSSHMDTVEPACGIEPVIGDDGIIRSKGDTILGSDDKAGIAIILHLARLAQAQPDVPRSDLEFSIHICEEIGLLGAKHIDTSDYKAVAGFILDDHDPKAVTIKSPSAVRIDFTITGKPAHAGVEPEKGISALEVAAEAISKMKLGRLDDETTANIGVISGGKATNIVTEKVVMKAEARSHNPQKLEDQVNHMIGTFEEVCAAWRSKKGDTVLPKVVMDRNDDYPAVQMDVNDYPVQLAVKAGKNLGWDIETKASGGGTDGSILNGKGVPCIVVGVGMQDVHTTDEWMSIEEFKDGARMVAEIVTTHAAQ